MIKITIYLIHLHSNERRDKMTSENHQNCIIVIPALEPDSNLINYVNLLITKKFKKILIVDDGSSLEYLPYFEALQEINCIVIHHEKNRGKGVALKTAFNYIKNNLDGYELVITLDSDGQHSINDACRIADYSKNKKKLSNIRS